MTDYYASQKHLAVFRGLTPRAQELEVEVIAHDGSMQLPSLGEFLLIQMSDKEDALARITHLFPSGPIASFQGESYLTELGRAGVDIPRQVREHVLRFTLRLVMLGRLQKGGERPTLKVGLRSFPPVGAKVFEPSRKALEFICNAGLSIEENKDAVPVPFGHYVLGDARDESIEIKFDINRLKAKRSFVFARAGYGKSNLIKYLISQLYASKPEVGLLIIDPEGEYAARSEKVPGLADVPGLARKLHVYSRRKPEQIGNILRGPVTIDFGKLSGDVLVTSFSPPEKHSMVWASWLRSATQKQISELVSLLHSKGYHAGDDQISRILGVQVSGKSEGGRNVSIGAILNNLLPAMKRLHDPQGLDVPYLRERLREGHVVILDTSLLSGPDARSITEIILTSLFYYNVRSFTSTGTDTRPIPCIAIFEEAQTILGHQGFSETSIFVRWVKEGRKYGLGSIMITQQPGAISDQILSQGDNFFVMHLLNQADLDSLHAVNAHFSPDILQQLRHEPIKGNCYFWSAPDQPYVVCARVHNFDRIAKLPHASASAATSAPPSFTAPPPIPPAIVTPMPPGIPLTTPSPNAVPVPLVRNPTLSRERILATIGDHDRVYVYEQASGTGLVCSMKYLAQALNAPELALRGALAEMGAQFGRGRLGAQELDVVVLERSLIQVSPAKQPLSSVDVALPAQAP